MVGERRQESIGVLRVQVCLVSDKGALVARSSRHFTWPDWTPRHRCVCMTPWPLAALCTAISATWPQLLRPLRLCTRARRKGLQIYTCKGRRFAPN